MSDDWRITIAARPGDLTSDLPLRAHQAKLSADDIRVVEVIAEAAIKSGIYYADDFVRGLRYALSASERRELYDAARKRCGLPTTGELEAKAEAERESQALRVRLMHGPPPTLVYSPSGAIVELPTEAELARERNEQALLEERREHERLEREQLVREREQLEAGRQRRAAAEARAWARQNGS